MLLDTPVTLDWARLAAIRRRVRVPLALHGGSGLDPALLSDAVCAGITKVNINTALRRAYLDATRDALAQTDALADLAAMHERQAAAIEAAATATLTALAAVHTTAGAHAWAG
jgi:fructose/tagatose bisphosphate aldolase